MAGEFEEGAMGGTTDKLTYFDSYLQTMITILTSETEREEKSHIEQLN